MKFIYVFHKDVAKDLEESGLQKYGETIIDGKPVAIFLNNKRFIYQNIPRMKYSYLINCFLIERWLICS